MDNGALIEKLVDYIEANEKTKELLVNSIVGVCGSAGKEMTEEEKLKAAYALNMCTVSVSQIIDYKDLNVLDQEYETILNNLNLEQMPKDEALLNILKQLLDTITYFKIEDVEKELIEKEYQQKMRNAIWSAVPNFGLLVAGKDPIGTAICLASQVGIGYMNYRRNIAEYGAEKEKKMWKLQRTAIEQFNGLRRELFDTAWRLADIYNFPDEYRLTERQITQYNSILMDKDEIRKYERLYSIKDNFQAYPPFWYFIGNSANYIACSKDFGLSEETKAFYRERACEYFEKYETLNQYNILREDRLVASCALEHIDLLLLEDKPKIDRINELLNIAVKMSGGANDILELCSIAYLKVKSIEKAKDLLRRLVNEDYNAILNAQILSNLYVSDFVYKNNAERSLIDYEILETRVEKEYLFPMPLDGIYDVEGLNRKFLCKQRAVLKEQYKLALNEFIKNYTIKYNKVFPVADVKKEYQDNYFLDGKVERFNRLQDIENVLSNRTTRRYFCERLKDDMIIYDMFEVINEMYESVCTLAVIDDHEFLEIMLTNGIVQCKENINKISEKLSNNKIDEIDIQMISQISFIDIVYDFFKELNSQIMVCIDECNTMTDIILTASVLRNFCRNQLLPDPDELFVKRNYLKETTLPKKLFSPRLLGKNYEELEKINETKDKLMESVSRYKEKLIKGEKSTLLISGTPEFDGYFRGANKKIQRYHNDAIAVIHTKVIAGVDLILTYHRAVIVGKIGPEIVRYNRIKYEGDALIGDSLIVVNDIIAWTDNPAVGRVKTPYDKKTRVNKVKYKNKDVDIYMLYSLIQECCEYTSRHSVEKWSDSMLDGKDYYDFLNVTDVI